MSKYEQMIKRNKTFTLGAIEYKIIHNPINGKPMLARTDGISIPNRKEICRKELRLHGWTEFGNKTTNELEIEILKLIQED